MKKTLIYILGLFLVFGFFACEGPLELEPAQSIDSEKLIVDNASAEVAMNGLYSNLQDFYGDADLIVTMDIQSDITDHIGTFTSWRDLDENNPFPDNTSIDDPWNAGYALIYNANVILDVLPGVDDPALDANRNQFLGEARTVRALAYFYLTVLWNDVPLITNPVTNLDEVNVAPSSQADIISFITGELNKALGELGDGGAATRVTKGAANALLAKIYAYTGDWANASNAADAVMAGGYTLVANYMSLFDGTISDEAIFQLDFNSVDANSLAFFYWDTPGGRHEAGPSDFIANAFDPADARSASIIDAPNSPQSPIQVAKYTDFATGTDKPYIVRLADIMLIKAEALAEMGMYPEATIIFNQVRERSFPGGAITLDAGNFKDVILTERMLELAWESGNRWYDMKRTGRASDLVTANGQDACKVDLPIIRAEIDANTAITQNPCY